MKAMIESTPFDVIIIGGSYSGLSAAMALGRSLRRVLIIDSNSPCNKQTPHSHNFITQDGETPASIAQKAKEQVLAYPNVSFVTDKAIEATGQNGAFQVRTEAGEVYHASKLLFTTGVKDIMPPLKGFAETWGISILHCPYCHGYEVNNQEIGILANGDMAFELVKLISNWSPKLAVLTNGKSTISKEQLQAIQQRQIAVEEEEIQELLHENGNLKSVLFKDGSTLPLKAAFARVPFIQHCSLPQELGCEITEQGYIKIDEFHKTNIPGVFAAGDNTSPLRAVSSAVAAGTKAGAMLNKQLIDERF